MPTGPASRIAYAGLGRSEHSASHDDGPGFENQMPATRDTDDGPSPTRNPGLSLPARAWVMVGAAAAVWAVAALGIALLV